MDKNIGDKDKRFDSRLLFVFLIFWILLLLIFGATIKLKVVERDEWVELEKKRILQKREYKAKRGNIYSIDPDNGEYLLLATNEPLYDVYVDLGKAKRKEKGKEIIDYVIKDSSYNKGINALCDSLAYMLKDRKNAKTSTEYKNYFNEKRKKNQRYVAVAKKVSKEELERMRRFPVIGYQKLNRKKKPTGIYRFIGAIHVEEGYKRTYPYYPLARRTIGVNVTEGGCDTCFNGIDGAFSKYLAGKSGFRQERKINPGEWVPVNINENIKTIDGLDVVTTIDISLQELAENSLRTCLDSNDAESGCVVLMEVKTGHIKAISNLSLNKDGEYFENNNIAVSDSYEPGSTFKIVTAMMLLDKGLVDTADVVEKGVKTYFNGSVTVRDDNAVDGEVSFARALEISSNVGISDIVYKHYGNKRSQFAEDLKEYFRFERLGLDIDVHEPRPYIGSTKNQKDLLWSSYGYVSRMTPLQMLTFYNAIANDGRMVKPMFVQSIIRDGIVQEEFETVVLSENICKKDTRDKLHNILKGVVQRGTGRRLRSASYGIAGKSGTAEENYGNKGISEKYNRASFVGYFPADAPKYSCIVVISNPKKHHTHGGDLAAPVFRNLSDRVVGSRMEVENAKIEASQIKYPILKYGNNVNYNAFCKSIGLNNSVPTSLWVRGKEENGICVVNEQRLSKEKVPNVIGLTIKDAIYMLENLGMKVKFSGKGKVVRQSIAPGTKFDKKNSVIVLELQSADRVN